MADLILALRVACAAGTADHLLGTVPYWLDDQLQDRLDRYRRTFQRVLLESDPVYVDGAYQYLDYQIPPALGEYFEESGTDSGWAVKDSGGDAAPSNTPSYQAQRITFAADTHGSAYFLDARTYDLNRCAAQVWREKAGFYAGNFDWSSDNHSIKARQQYENAIAKAKEFDSKAGITVSRMFRTDEVPNW